MLGVVIVGWTGIDDTVATGSGAGDGFLGGTGGGTVDNELVAGVGAVCERACGPGDKRLRDLEGPNSAAAAAPRFMKDLNSYFAVISLSTVRGIRHKVKHVLRMNFSRSLSRSESTILVGGGCRVSSGL